MEQTEKVRSVNANFRLNDLPPDVRSFVETLSEVRDLNLRRTVIGILTVAARTMKRSEFKDLKPPMVENSSIDSFWNEDQPRVLQYDRINPLNT